MWKTFLHFFFFFFFTLLHFVVTAGHSCRGCSFKYYSVLGNALVSFWKFKKEECEGGRMLVLAVKLQEQDTPRVWLPATVQELWEWSAAQHLQNTVLKTSKKPPVGVSQKELLISLSTCWFTVLSWSVFDMNLQASALNTYNGFIRGRIGVSVMFITWKLKIIIIKNDYFHVDCDITHLIKNMYSDLVLIKLKGLW